MKAYISWSGGKEASLSCYRAMQDKNIEVAYLLNMISESGEHSRTHGISANLMRLQAEAMGIPIMQRKTEWESYEVEYRKAILDLKKEDISSGIFGDIDLQEHRDWVEKVCKDADLTAILPLWKGKREDLLHEFIDAGFKAIIVATQASCLGKEWLNRQIDNAFIKELKSIKNVDLCGEKGEYHSFVYDGPIFKKPVKFTVGKKVYRNKHWFLELI